MDILTLNLQIYILIISVLYIFEGIISVFFIKFAYKFNKHFYGFDSKPENKIILICKPWGSLLLITGIAGLFAVYNPIQYFGVVLSYGVLLALRVYYRYAFRFEIRKEFKAPFYRNYINILILIYGVLSIILWSLTLVIK